VGEENTQARVSNAQRTVGADPSADTSANTDPDTHKDNPIRTAAVCFIFELLVFFFAGPGVYASCSVNPPATFINTDITTIATNRCAARTYHTYSEWP